MQDAQILAQQADRLVRLTKKATTNLSRLGPEYPPPRSAATAPVQVNPKADGPSRG